MNGVADAITIAGAERRVALRNMVGGVAAAAFGGTLASEARTR